MTQEKTKNIAVIGNGDRAKYVVGNLLRDSDHNVKIVTVYDPVKSQSEAFLKQNNSPDAKICDSYQEAINYPGIDWVMVFSPNAFHKEQILAAFEANKHVFSEKPLATSIEDCKEIYDAHQKTNLLFMTGFVLRYSKIYKKVKELLDSGSFGEILSIDANENIDPAHGAYIMTNWRRNTKLSGPHILEKCCHDLDLINFFIGSLPSKIASFGGLDYFTPKHQKHFEEYGEKYFLNWHNPLGIDCPFTSDKDIMDNQVAIMQYRNGTKVQFQATMSNAIPERRMYFSCTKGNIIVELYSSSIKYRRHKEEEYKTLNYGADGHGGGDAFLMKELYNTMVTGDKPRSSGNEGLESAVTALAIDQAAQTNSIIDLEPIWKNLNR